MKHVFILLITIYSLQAFGQTDHIYQINMGESGSLRVGGVNNDSLYWVPYKCPHIYVAVLPDTLVWDKEIKRYGSLRVVTGTLDTLPSYNIGTWQYMDPKPYTQKIVCILCHKVTEQQIKIINEPKN